MSYDNCVRIESLANGYTITVKDPAIVAANQKSDRGSSYRYKDPDRCYAFKDIKEVNAWLTANLDKALPKDAVEDSFDKTFDKAAKIIEKE